MTDGRTDGQTDTRRQLIPELVSVPEMVKDDLKDPGSRGATR